MKRLFVSFILSVFFCCSVFRERGTAAIDHASPQALGLYKQGADSYADGKNTDAIRYLEKALLLNPRLDEAKGLLIIALGETAFLFYENSAYEEALPLLNKLLKLLPDDKEVTAMYREAQSNYRQASSTNFFDIESFDLSVQFQTDWMVYVGLGKGIEQYEERIAYLISLYALYAGTMVNTESVEKEIDLLDTEQQERIFTFSREDQMSRAIAWYKQKRYRDAQRLWEHMQLQKPEQDIEYYLLQTRTVAKEHLDLLAVQYRDFKKKGAWDKAFDVCTEMFNADRTHAQARIGVKEIHTELMKKISAGLKEYQSNNYRGAIKQWQQIANLFPGYRHIDRYMEHAQNIISQGEREQQFALAKSYITEGDDLYQQGRIFDAVKQWQKVLSVNVENKDAPKRIAKALEKLYANAAQSQSAGNTKETVEQWEMIASIDPGYRDVKSKIARMVKKPSVNTSPLITQAEASYNAGDYVGALSSIAKVLDLDPGNKRAIMMASESALAQGIVYYRSDKLKEAIELWDYVLKFSPSNEKARKYKQRAELKINALKKLE